MSIFQIQSRLLSIFLLVSLAGTGCIDVTPEDLHLHYEGEWAIEKLVQVDAQGVENIQENPGTLILGIDPDKATSGPGSFNPMGFSGDVFWNLYAFNFMATRDVGSSTLYWFTDENEYRIFLRGIGPLTTYVLVYTIQEQDIEVQRGGQMTWYIRMDDGRQETVYLKKL